MTEKVYPNITAVDENDEVIGYFQLFDAIAKGYIRRISTVFVLDDEGRILIQRRAANVLSPNLLDFSAAGHVNEGQDYETCAKSELYEELALKDVTLEQITAPFPTPGFYNTVFVAKVLPNISLTINPEEVAAVFWVSYEELSEMIAHHPQQFTEPFLAVWPHVCDTLKPI